MVVEDDDPRSRAVADDDVGAARRECAVGGEVPGAEKDRAARRTGHVHGAARVVRANVELVVAAAAADEVERLCLSMA